VFDGGRGSANTFFDFIIEEDGFYPFTLFWWEGTGGANVEWFNDDGNTGQRILINDRTNPNAIKAYREGASRPYISSAAPHDLLSTFTHWDNPMMEVPLDATVQVTLVDGSTQLDPASVQMTINAASVTPVVNKTGNTTTVQFNPGGLDRASRYVVGLSYADNSNPPVTRTAQWLFWTTFEGIFTSDTFFIETEDFNYEGGKFIAEANSPTYSGGAYANLVPLLGVDYNEVLGGDDAANAGTQYRNIPTENIRVGMATIGDNQRGPDRVLTTDYKVGWNDNGDWYNFTRDFPAGAYNVFGRLSSGTANINSIHAQLLEVTSDPAQPDQTTQLLGTFRWRKSGGWNTFITVPLLDQSGNIATVNLDGQTTVRLAIQPGNLDSNYLAFVPTESDPDPANPVFSSFQLQGGNIILEWTGGGALQRASSILGPWEPVSNAATPASIPVTGPTSFFRILR
jgi:hypothetical protein